MGTAEVLCEPSMVPDFQGSYTSEEPLGSDNSHSFSVEGPTTVPCSAGNAIQPVTLLTDPRPVLADVKHQSYGPATPTDHMAHLQEKLSTQKSFRAS